ncbi:MAG: FmdB family zinc ribbon protein [Candidatus Thorarchaeota archaeon]
MSIYIYKCPKCSNTKEIIHKMTENPSVLCSECEILMNRILFPVNFRIRGYYTSKTGYSKNPEYMKAVERKKKAERKR